jgi:hypothetical protein
MATTVLGWSNIVTEPNLVSEVFGPNFPITSSLPPQNLAISSGSPATGWQCPTQPVGNYPLLRLTPASRRTIGAMGFFRTNLTSAAVVTMLVYTGTPAAATQVFRQDVSPIDGIGQVLAFPANVLCDFCQFAFIDPGNPDGFINVPIAYVGPTFIPITGVSWATTHGRDDNPDVVVSRGGQEFVTLKWQRRRLELAFDGLRQSEIWSQVDALRSAARTGINVLAVPDTTNGNAQYEAVFGRLQDTADVTYPYGNADRRAWHAKITERL